MILFFDIDGTLIDEKKHEIPESAREGIVRARKNGHICMINTGRAGSMVGPEIRNLVEMDGYVMGCGTMIEYGGEVIFHQSFTRQEADDMIAGLRKYHIDAVLEGANSCFCDLPEEMYSREFTEFVRKWMKLGYQREAIKSAPGYFDKFYCYMGEEESRKGFMKEFGDRLDFIDREHGYYEVTPKGFSKAHGMRLVAGHLGVPMKDTAAIGDSNNDLSMLECAGRAIAMGQSSKEVLRMADYVTTDLQENGIWNALKWLGVL